MSAPTKPKCPICKGDCVPATFYWKMYRDDVVTCPKCNHFRIEPEEHIAAVEIHGIPEGDFRASDIKPLPEFGPSQAWYSRAELTEKAKEWMKSRQEFYDEDAYFARLGLLVDFISDHFPK